MITLSVTDDDGGLDSAAQTVTVTAPSQPPAAPTNLTASIERTGKGKGKNKTITAVTLNWIDNANNEDSYVIERCEETGRGILAEAIERAEVAGVESATELAWGRVPEVVCRVAQDRGCDLIVVGSRGLTGFKRLMLGSISNAVAAKAPCPVLVVKWYGDREP